MRTTTNTNAKNQTVPFFILRLPDGRIKALFTVPSNMAETLVIHPIFCRGGSFDLQIDAVNANPSRERSNYAVRSTTETIFISTIFCSPYPDETARAIAQRIAIRQEDPSPAVSHLFGR
uniref:Uncharacterized protein n=1 Tax=Pseudo-nitzschia australis TaxID=44445 RepID=A0A7S4AMB3_9STRA|mmetsp:Transcript_8035/g.17298  ORF Transcript_8035/g.17298 Transcript_8035/m.17298 type:complete len:119 (+) Transcript_8035:176-532(+)